MKLPGENYPEILVVVVGVPVVHVQSIGIKLARIDQLRVGSYVLLSFISTKDLPLQHWLRPRYFFCIVCGSLLALA